MDYVAAIQKLRKEKNAIILAHYYQIPEIQDIADYVGDSLGLAQKAAETNADLIVFAGVHFMAETAKILNPNKKVLLPDLEAGCSLAASCPPVDFKKFKAKYPDHIVLSYINCTAGIKELSDVIVTSGNAVEIVESFGKDEKIIFAPDKNLGGYINNLTGRDMVLWDGTCEVHDILSTEAIINLKIQNPQAELVAHFLVVPKDKTCSCNDCPYMKLNTMEKLYNCLAQESPEINLDAEVIQRAEKPITRMLDISREKGLI
ncbi:MAG: quinolinate synthase [Bacteroidetes bacterium 4572_77]|nr:MAG: quinolinate synthase [Bacteroidetes bacterium 4572_77]